MTPTPSADRHAVRQARQELLQHLVALTSGPMVVLSFVWLGLLILDFTSGLSPLLQGVSNVIWGLFVLQFLIELLVAPRKWEYLRRHWPTALSLLLPAFRLLRVAQAARALRVARVARAASAPGMTGSLSLLRLLTATNRGMLAVRATLGHRRVGYVATLTAIVTFAGAAGMYYYESPAALRHAGLAAAVQGGAGLHSYGESVWWTAMIMTTMGSAYWPLTTEGRILCWLLALYAFGVFGYITATIASYFVGRDVSTGQDQAPAGDGAADATAATGDAPAEAAAAALRADIAALHARIEALAERLGAGEAAREGR